MATAMLYPDKHQGRKATSPESGEVSQQRLSQARKVLRLLPDVARDVLANGVSLNDAYELARAALQ